MADRLAERGQAVPATAPERLAELHQELMTWVAKARAAGLDDEGISALVALSVRPGETSPRQVSPGEIAREEITR